MMLAAQPWLDAAVPNPDCQRNEGTMKTIRHSSDRHLLETLCRIPTLSYYERGIAEAIWQMCERFDLHVTSDRWCNLFASCHGVPPSEARVAFVAHMDHPGFELVERNEDGTYRAISHGGVPRVAFVPRDAARSAARDR